MFKTQFLKMAHSKKPFKISTHPKRNSATIKSIKKKLISISFRKKIHYQKLFVKPKGSIAFGDKIRRKFKIFAEKEGCKRKCLI